MHQCSAVNGGGGPHGGDAGQYYSGHSGGHGADRARGNMGHQEAGKTDQPELIHVIGGIGLEPYTPNAFIVWG